MSADSEPLEISTKECAGSTLDGERESNEIQSKEEKATNGEKMDENVCRPIVGNGKEDKEQVVDEKNDEAGHPVNEIEVSRADNVLVSGETQGYPEEVNDGSGVANTDEMTVQEVPVKENETLIYGLDIKDIDIREERKSSEVAADKKVVGGFAPSEHEITDENLAGNLQNEKEASKLNVEAAMGTILDNGKLECRREDASIANIVKDNVSITKRRRLNRKVFENMTLGNNAASMNEANPFSSIGNDACDKTKKVDPDERVRNDNKADAKPLVEVRRKLNRVTKKEVAKGHASMMAISVEQKFKPTNGEPENMQNRVVDERRVKNEVAGESRDRVSHLQTIREEKVEKQHAMKVGSERSKFSMRADSMGMIFMCSSETKEDCYRYRVLGLPAGKKDIVLKIYKGMRLFLFDFNLKMMYGIYKAAGPGGYNIEPRAFRSQFPSQVRFTILEDCVPLAEEKFKSVIKDNYYTKKKFNFQLTSEQVKNLCKLFLETTKRAKPKPMLRGRIPVAPSSIQQDRKRRRVEDSIRVQQISSWERSRRLSEEGMRLDPLIVSESYHHHLVDYEHRLVYDEEIYLPSAAPPPLHQPVPAQDTPHSLSYSYGGVPLADICRRDLSLEHNEPSLCECVHPIELDHHNPYISYVESHAYREPAYETLVSHMYQEPAYEVLRASI